MNHYAVIAGDFADIGGSAVHFAAAGIKTALSFDGRVPDGILRDHDAVALSPVAKPAGSGGTAAALGNAVRDCRAVGAELFFLAGGVRPDGNPGADIEAALDALDYPAALVCPAAPGAGVFVENGSVVEKGVPAWRIADLLAGGTRLPIGHLAPEETRGHPLRLRRTLCALLDKGCRILIPDAADEEDLRVLGKALREAQDDGPTLLPRLLPVGSGALAAAFAGPALSADIPELRGRMLVVAAGPGRLDARTRGDFVVLELDMEAMSEDPAAAIARLLRETDDRPEKHLLLKSRGETARDKDNDRVSAARKAGILGEAARAICVRIQCSRVYVADGASAPPVAAALGIKTATLSQRRIPEAFLASCSTAEMPIRWFGARVPPG